ARFGCVHGRPHRRVLRRVEGGCAAEYSRVPAAPLAIALIRGASKLLVRIRAPVLYVAEYELVDDLCRHDVRRDEPTLTMKLSEHVDTRQLLARSGARVLLHIRVDDTGAHRNRTEVQCGLFGRKC